MEESRRKKSINHQNLMKKVEMIDLTTESDDEQETEMATIEESTQQQGNNGTAADAGTYTPAVKDVQYMYYQNEIKRLEYLRAVMEPEVQRHRDQLPKMKSVRQFKVTHIESPYNFYLKYTDDEHPDNVYEQMQEYYDNPLHLQKLKYDPVFDVKLYLYKYTGSDGKTRWERVRVTARNPHEKYCRIFLIDIGVSEAVYYHELYNLEYEFTKVAPHAIRAYMIDVLPPNGQTKWPEESIEVFKKLLMGSKDKELNGIGLNKFSEKEDSDFMEHCERYGVILFIKGEKHTLNSELCRLGAAEPAGLGASRRDLLEVHEENEDNATNRTCDFTIAKLADIICDELEEANEEKPYIRPYADFIKKLEDTVIQHRRAHVLPIPRQVQIRLLLGVQTTFYNTACLYFQLFEKLPLYETMVEHMRQIMPSIPAVNDRADIKAGTFLLLVRTDDIKHPVQRAIAREGPAHATGLLKAFMIDTGKPVAIKFQHARLLPEYLCKIPPFCYRVHLDSKHCKPSAGASTWSTIADNHCRAYFSRPLPQTVFYAWRHPGSTVIELDDLDTKVMYNTKKKSWTKQKESIYTLTTIKPEDVATLKSMPLLRQLFTSVGIEIAFFTVPSTTRYLSFTDHNLGTIIRTAGHGVDA